MSNQQRLSVGAKAFPIFFIIHFLCFIFLIAFAAESVKAFSLDSTIFYFSDNFKSTSTKQNSLTFMDFGITSDMDKKASLAMGWNVLMITQQTKNTTTENFSVMDMGPKLNWYFDKDHNWGMEVAYHLLATATYKVTTAEKWRGSSIKAAFGYSTVFGEQFLFGLWLNYFAGSYPEKITNQTNYAKVSYNRSYILPAIRMSWHF